MMMEDTLPDCGIDLYDELDELRERDERSHPFMTISISDNFSSSLDRFNHHHPLYDDCSSLDYPDFNKENCYFPTFTSSSYLPVTPQANTKRKRNYEQLTACSVSCLSSTTMNLFPMNSTGDNDYPMKMKRLSDSSSYSLNSHDSSSSYSTIINPQQLPVVW
jgi:hypothetical protein